MKILEKVKGIPENGESKIERCKYLNWENGKPVQRAENGRERRDTEPVTVKSLKHREFPMERLRQKKFEKVTELG